MVRILGLDVGTARVGVALSDPLGMTAQPLEVIVRKRADPFARVAELIALNEVERVVVGNPLKLDGGEGLAVEAVGAFVAELERHISVPIELWDERLTTAAAERALLEGDVRRRERRDLRDKIAAALILQSYLDAKVPA